MKKITSRKQMILYAVSGLGVNMLNLMMGSYLCSALLVGGFGAEAIPFQTYAQRDLVIAGVWSVFVLIAKIVDGIIDIPMASFTDRLKSRWGRRRPAILIGLIPMIVSFLLFLVVPTQAATIGNTIYYGIVLCIFYSFYTLTMVTYYATFTEIVETADERTLISNTKSVCDITYFILGYVLVRALLNGINVRTVSLMVLPLVLTMLIPLFMIKEGSTLDGPHGEVSERINLIESMKVTLKNRDFIIWMIVYFFMTFGVQLFLGGINEYFSYVGMNMIFVMVASFAPVPFTLILYNKVQRKKGFGFAFKLILLDFSLGMFLLFAFGLMPDGTAKTILSVLMGIVCSFGIGALFSVAYSVPSQLAAEEEERTGISNGAMYFAVQGLFSGVATGLATGVVLTALKGSEEAASGNIVYMTLIAGLGTLVAFAFCYILPRSVKMMGKQEDK